MLAVHPVADLLPEMTAGEYAYLRDSISANGLREPVTLHRDGRLIDGRHRARACEELGLPLPTRVFEGSDAEILEFVLDLNLQRRHLSETQRAAIAAELPALRQGARTDLASIEAKSQSERADLLNVSRSAVQRAEIVRERGIPELFQAIKRDRLPVSQAVVLADMEPGRQRAALDRIVAGQRACHVVLSERRTERAQEIEQASAAQPLASLGRRFPVIYADPPWHFESWTPAGMGRAAEQHYPCMTLEDICALPVSDIAADDAVLFMWATAPMIPEALRVVEAWGFAYKTNAIWAKDSIGLGYWLRNQHEHLIIATRGNMPPPAHARSSVFHGASGRHSQKPASVRDWIRDAYPDVGRIELFARDAAPGWTVWGHEAV